MKKTRPTGTRKKAAGFSLLEVTVSMGIMALSLMALLSLTCFSVQNKENQREQEIARQSAAAVHESLKAQTAGVAFETIEFVHRGLL